MKKIVTLLTFCFLGGILSAQTTPALKVDENGNIGIGTATPQNKLHIKDGSILFEPSINANNNRSTVNMKSISESTRFQFQSGDGTNNSWSFFAMFGDENNDATNRRGEVAFSGQYHRFFTGVTDVAGGNQFGDETMRIQRDGRVGIGFTAVPGDHQLAVNGTIQATQFVEASDKKLKSNITKFQYGLDEVLKMQPRFYEFNGDMIKNDGLKAGVLAQEMEKIMPESVYDVEYVEKNLENQVVREDSYKVVNTSMIRYALVNAVQEQQTMIEDLRKENDELRELLSEIVEKLENTDQANISATLNGNDQIASLGQNNPNPFDAKTSIPFFVPVDAESASIAITSATGQILKTVKITDRGQGVLDLNANNLPKGAYHYTLVVDGQSIKTNKMIHAR